MTWQQRREAIFCVIEWLTRQGMEFYGPTFPDVPGNQEKVDQVRVYANRRHSIMSLDEVGRFRSGTDIDFGSKVALIRPPGGRTQTVALLHCHYVHDDRLRQCRFYYGLWERLDTHPDVDRPASVVVFSAFRAEMPEVGTNHNYFHSQFCSSMGNERLAPAEAIKLNHTYPAWPISADDEVELALSLVVALYGFDGFGTFETYTRSVTKWRHHNVLQNSCTRVRERQRHR